MDRKKKAEEVVQFEDLKKKHAGLGARDLRRQHTLVLAEKQKHEAFMSKFSTGNKKTDNQEEIGDAYNFHKTLKKKLNEQFWDEEENAKDKATFIKSTATSLTDQLTKSFATQVQNDKERSEKMRVNTQGQKNV